MKNIKTKSKFLISYGVLLLLIIIMGITSYFCAKDIRFHTELGNMVGEILEHVNTASTSFGIMHLDESERERSDSSVHKNLKQAADDLNTFIETSDNEKNKKLAAEVLESVTHLLSLISEFAENPSSANVEQLVSRIRLFRPKFSD